MCCTASLKRPQDLFRKSHEVEKSIRADDFIVGSEISWWLPNILPLGSGSIRMVPKNPIPPVPKYPVTPCQPQGQKPETLKLGWVIQS